MKRSMVIVLAMLLPMLSASAQESSDTTAAKPTEEVKAKKDGGASKVLKGKKYIDEDGDGIPDRIIGGPNAMNRWGKDRFIDRDGDGICDERVSGLGFRRGKTGLRPGGTGSTGDSGGKGKGPGGRR